MRRAILPLLLLLLWGLCPTLTQAQHYSGRVRDAETGRTLPSVEILTERGRRLTETDASGAFAFEHPTDSLRVLIFAPSYARRMMILHSGSPTDVQLSPLRHELKEVTVTGRGGSRGNNSFDYTPSDAKGLATLTGEVDVMRYLQILPGVAQGMEGGLGFYVRGAGNGNNRTELDGIPITAPTHLLGIFSSFHPDIVGQSTFQMGGITPSSGDFTSSLLQLRTQRPSADRYSGSLALSPLMVGGSLQGYLSRGKLAFQIAGRTSILRPEFLLLKAIFGKDNVSGDFNPEVQDLYTKVRWELSPEHATEVLLFGSWDYLSYFPGEEEGVVRPRRISFGWNNRAARVSWLYTPTSSPLRLETAAYYTLFRTRQGMIEEGNWDSKQGIVLGSEKSELALRSHLTTKVGALDLGAGIDLRQQRFNPLMQVLATEGNKGQDWNPDFTTTIGSLFAEGGYRTPRYSVTGGLRYDAYRDDERRLSHNIDVRLKGSLTLTHVLSLEASYDRMTQYQHTLEGLPLGWALDLIIPASRSFRPEHADQWYLGGVWSTPQLYVTLGGYYRRLTGLTAYSSWLNQFTLHNVSWREEVIMGQGQSYGLELWVEKRQGPLTGSISYTLSRTTRTFSELNGGRAFPFRFDRTHNLNLQSRYETLRTALREQHLSLSCYLTSGSTMTIPVASYQAEELPYWHSQSGGIFVPPLQEYHATTRTEMSSVNGYRLPPYIRLDAGYSFLWRRSKVTHELTLSVYNLLNRKNPFLVYNEKGKWRQLSILSLVPSIRWELRF